MPGNIWVDSTVTENSRRPRKRYRLTANAAKMAIATEMTVATPDTIRLLTRYRPSGTVLPDVDERPAASVGWASR